MQIKINSQIINDIKSDVINAVNKQEISAATVNSFKNSSELTIVKNVSDSFENIASIQAKRLSYEKQLEEFGEALVRLTDRIIPKSSQSYESYEEIITVHRYQLDDTFADILRAGKTPPEEVKTLDKIIEKSAPLTGEATVYRSVSYRGWKELQSKLVKGGIIEDKAFGSTSKCWDGIAKMWHPKDGEGVTLRINLPKGTKGIDCSRSFTKPLNLFEKLMGKKPKTNYTYYSGEFILPRGYKLQVTNVDLDTGIVDCDYILPK